MCSDSLWPWARRAKAEELPEWPESPPPVPLPAQLRSLHSAMAAGAESKQALLCTYLSAVLLAGQGLRLPPAPMTPAVKEPGSACGADVDACCSGGRVDTAR